MWAFLTNLVEDHNQLLKKIGTKDFCVVDKDILHLYNPEDNFFFCGGVGLGVVELEHIHWNIKKCQLSYKIFWMSHTGKC